MEEFEVAAGARAAHSLDFSFSRDAWRVIHHAIGQGFNGRRV
jgi:hypothetical protein